MSSKNVTKGESERLLGNGEELRKPILPLVGEILAGVFSGLVIFTVFVALKITEVINWNYWFVFSPIWVVLLALLLLTQSKRLTTRTNLIVRLAWLLCVISIMGHLILLNMKLEE